jgi:hypothetical protein
MLKLDLVRVESDFRWIVLSMAVVALIAAACSSGESSSRTACEQAFYEASQISDFQDTVEDLYPAARACGTVDEWVQANTKYPGAIDGSVSPVLFLQNVCRYGPSTAAICPEALSR